MARLTPGRRSRIRDELAPQLRDYVRMGSGVRWLPFVMFLQQGGFRSPTVNTDRFGFRWTVSPEGKVWSVEEPPDRESGLVLGGSTAFGVGARGDAATVASVLAARTGRPWLNLGGRGHVSTQELLAFLEYEDTLPPLRDIVLLSGLNDLSTQYGANRWDDRLGGFLQSEYARAIAALEPSRWRQKRLRRALLRAGRQAGGSRPFEEILAEREGRRASMLRVQARNLGHWAALAAARGARVWFALQPLFPWLGKEASREEHVLFDSRMRQDPRQQMVVERALAPEQHAPYAEALASLCRERGIGFLDLNRELRPHATPDAWLFVDRAHLTDRGYALCAECLLERLE